MFGHNDHDDDADNHGVPEHQDQNSQIDGPVVGGLGMPPAAPNDFPPAPVPAPVPNPTLSNVPAHAINPEPDHVAPPIPGPDDSDDPTSSSPVVDARSVNAADEPTGEHKDDLIDLKSKALHQLVPLVGQLDQTPEEKFKTTMMMIQASDNQALVKDAYEAAQQIPDEKAKAQALLDVVNEINYFTQHQDS